MLEHIAADLDLTDPERAEVLRFLDHPVGMEEAETLAKDLFPKLTAGDRQVWIDRLQKIIMSDAHIDPGEVKLLETVREAVKRAEEGPSILGRLRGFFRSERAGEVAKPRPGGVLSRLLERTKGGGEQAGRGEDRLHRTSLFGAILYRVAFADGEFSDEEAGRLRALLTGTFGFHVDEAQQVLAVIESRAAEDLDRQRLCASFNRISDMNERMKLLGCLFMIAEADGEIHETELREMRLIANYLWIGAKDFHQVRIGYRAKGNDRAT